MIKENSNFEQTFASLGNSELLSDTLFTELQEFVCCLYGYHEKSVDAFRYKLFKKKNWREHKIPDLASLPPCQQVLRLNSLRANAIASIWKNSMVPRPPYSNVADCGWNMDGEIHWLNECFLDDVENILMCEECEESNSESDQEYGSDVESGDSESQF